MPEIIDARTGVPMPDQGLITLTHVIYALHAFSALTGLAGSVFVVTAFLTGWPSIIAVILNYAKRSDVRGTFLDSHFGWQIRTFWYAALWAVIVALVSAPLTLVIVGFGTWAVGMFLLGVWAIYRIARGWLRLSDHKPMPV